MAPLDRVLNISGNRHVFERLRELLASGKAIAFSGAGASAALYPLWPELVHLLIGEAVKPWLASEADRATWERLAATRPLQVAQGVKERLGRQVHGVMPGKVGIGEPTPARPAQCDLLSAALRQAIEGPKSPSSLRATSPGSGKRLPSAARS